MLVCFLLAEVGGPHFKPTGRLEHFGASFLTGVYDDGSSEYSLGLWECGDLEAAVPKISQT